MKFNRKRKYYSATAYRNDRMAGGDIAVLGGWHRTWVGAVLHGLLNGLSLGFGFLIEVESQTAEEIAEWRLIGRKFAKLR